MVRIAVIEKERCHPDRCGNYLCARLCPVNRTGSDCIVQGSDGKAFIHANLCTGCGICPKRCPFGAIHIINLPEALNKPPVHQYIDANGFRLFNLPTPMFGKVVGILGRNGIGKSTALKVLAGILKPNLGVFEGEPDFNDLIKFYKGTEAQIFFEKLRDGEIKAVYKPQAVDLIPKSTSGTVEDVLKKVDEKGEFGKIVRELELERFLQSNLSDISGGELQRVAIAATILKKGNLYIFDEPTSYLDIKQRLKVANLIKSLATEDTAVLVVEHDLIMLDHLADLVYIVYGEEAAYGIVSQIKPTRVAINVYLDGYLKEENVRFRDSNISFDSRPTHRAKQRTQLTSWKDIELTQGNFKLTAHSGKIYKHTVIGILGENGIGKTTFVRILAGVMQAEKGEVETKVKVSYKPQYVHGESSAKVKEILGSKYEQYETQIMKPLRVDRLTDMSLNELSGGELQRVAIARCLTQDADLYLLDEPCAYLDVEQRLVVSKIIREQMEQKGKSALIVDHDLLFIDYVADDLIVFEGIPAREGQANGPFSMEEGMNLFLGNLNITVRRDHESKRPRINKENSQLDREQKSSKRLYYS
ncbi:MAG: ribosome biogenesis/translation initiation ATPase RLI [Nanoarchaeota archaeon]|nr:MAG: ribosome biogenesis/translation initiation ATPase RLI [Nanoarchaeota archaeon]